MEQETQHTQSKPIFTFIIAGLMLLIGIFGMTVLSYFSIGFGFMDTHCGLPCFGIVFIPSFIIFIGGLLTLRKKRIGWWFLIFSFLIIFLPLIYISARYFLEVEWRSICFDIYHNSRSPECLNHSLRSLLLTLQSRGNFYLSIMFLFPVIIGIIFLLIEKKKFWRITS